MESVWLIRSSEKQASLSKWSRRGPLGPKKKREKQPTMTLYLKQFYEKAYADVVSKEEVQQA